MVADVIVYGSLATMVVILVSILGTIGRVERYGFVVGLLLFMVAHVLPFDSATVGGGLAAVGLLVAAGSSLGMLREPAAGGH